MISPDSPIQNSTEDRLGRTSFATALAKAITNVSGLDSFVIGIHGKWGSGKSSVLNLIIEELEKLDKLKPDEERTHVLRFNPWNFSDQNQLVFQFLKQFRAHLLESKKAPGRGLEKLAGALADYGDALSPPLTLLPYGSLWSSGWKLVAKTVKDAFGSPLEKDVNSAFDKISREAANLKYRTVVVIDDIDRLSATETRQIFQLAKLTARFPYVVYLLAFDRTAVAKCLQEVGIDSGNEYLEKIVQVSFDLPPITDTVLTQLITQGIDEVLKKFQPAHFDQTRFGNLFYGGFRQSFVSLRHIKKFINGLEFAFGIVGQELNGVDIIGVEAIRLLYPNTYEAVRTNRQIFAGHIDRLTSEQGASTFTSKVDSVLKETGELSETLKNLLIEIFPKITFAYGRSNYGHESETFWEKTHRVATTRYFDAYFQLSLGPTEVSVSEVGQLIANSGDEPILLAGFRQLRAAGKIKRALESVRFRLSEISALNLPYLLSVLIQLGEELKDDGSLFAGVASEYQHVQWLIFDVLDKLVPTERSTILLTIAKTRFAPKTLLDLVTVLPLVREEHARYAEFSDDRIAEIRSAMVKSIEDEARQDRISVKQDSLPAILRIWTTWGKPENARAYVGRVTRSDDDIIDLVNRFIYQTHSYGAGDRVGQTHNKLATKGLASVLDLTDLRRQLERMDDGKLNSERNQVRRIALRQLKKMQEKGMTPEQFDSGRYFEDE